jgi:hypothetical protein
MSVSGTTAGLSMGSTPSVVVGGATSTKQVVVLAPPPECIFKAEYMLQAESLITDTLNTDMSCLTWPEVGFFSNTGLLHAPFSVFMDDVFTSMSIFTPSQGKGVF